MCCGWVEMSRIIVSFILCSVLVTVPVAVVMALPGVEVPGVVGVPL